MDSAERAAARGSARGGACNGDDDEAARARAADIGVSSDLLEREKKFRELNKQIKSKAAHVIQEAEKVVNESLSILSTDIRKKPTSSAADGPRSHTSADVSGPPRSARSRPPSGGAASAYPQRARPRSAFAGSDRASAGGGREQSPARAAEEITESLAVKVALAGPPAVPGMTEGMGSEATERFLRAKTLALTEELDKTMTELKEKDIAALKAAEQAKAANDELARLSKSSNALQKEQDAAVRQIEELTKKNGELEAKLSAAHKDLDKLARIRKQSEADIGSSKVRLNRALEEADRCKQLAARAQQDAKASAEAGRVKAEKWANECRRLEKQKQELMLAFKKQGQLVEVLKRQKSHAEAAKLLEITEAEFMKTLDWKV